MKVAQPTVTIELLFLDLQTCDRCCDTDRNLDMAVEQVRSELEAQGTTVQVRYRHVTAEAQAVPLGFEISPTILLSVKTFRQRHNALEHREHLYHNVAAQLVRDYGLIAIKDTDFSTLAQKTNLDDVAADTLNERARANRFIASPSLLRLAITQAAQRERCELIKVAAAYTTVTCSTCGHVHGGPIKDLIFVCDACGTLHDQDNSSAALVLKTALESVQLP
jgi:hypothetical protein